MVFIFTMHADLRFLASAAGFLPIETTSHLCLPWLNDVVNPVISDIWKNPLVDPGPVQVPWLQDTDIHTESGTRPRCGPSDQHLHCLAVVLHHERLSDLHCLCLSSGPALCYLGRCNPLFETVLRIYVVVMPVYHSPT